MSSNPVTFEELAQAAPAGTTEPAQTTAPAATEQVPEAATTPAFTEADAQAYRTLVDAGITPQNHQEFLQAKQALRNLDTIMRTNPDLFMDEIEKSDPELHRQLLDRISDRWFNRLPEEMRNGPQQPNGSASSTVNSPDVSILRTKLDEMGRQMQALVERTNREDTERQQREITDGFNGVLDKLSIKLPEKLDDRAKDHIRLKAQELIWKDPAARARCAKGVYVDVAKYFTDATKFVTAESKTAADTERASRQRVEDNGQRTVTPAAEPTGGVPVATERHVDPIWGNISSQEVNAALAKK